MDTRLFVLSIGSFVGTMESFVLPGLLPSMASELNLTASQVGYLVFAYSLAYALAGPVLSSFFGSTDRRRTLSIAELIFGCSALFMAAMPIFALIVSGRIVLAAGAVLFTTMAQATAIALSAPEYRGRAVSIVVTGGTVAVAIGAPLGAMLAARYGWRVTYGLVGLIALAASLVIWLRLPRGITGPRLPLRERLAVLGNRGMPVALLMSFLYMVGAFMPAIYVAAISFDAMGMEKAWLPLVLFANGLGAFAGGIVGGQVADRFGPYRSYVVNAIVAAIVFSLISVLPLLPAPFHSPVWLALMFLAGLLGWALFSGQVALFAILAPTSVPLAVSLNLSAVSVGAAIAALIGGLVIDLFGAGAIGVTAAACALLGLGLAFAYRETLSGQR